jgi:hypothetical protein
MDTDRSISFTSLRQVNERLFNHSVHLSGPSPSERSRMDRRADLEAAGPHYRGGLGGREGVGQTIQLAQVPFRRNSLP